MFYDLFGQNRFNSISIERASPRIWPQSWPNSGGKKVNLNIEEEKVYTSAFYITLFYVQLDETRSLERIAILSWQEAVAKHNGIARSPSRLSFLQD